MPPRRERLPRIHEAPVADAPTPADRAPYPTFTRHLTQGILAGAAAFGLWGLLEAMVRGMRQQGAAMEATPVAQSLAAGALIGAAAGLLLGLAGGAVHAVGLRAHQTRPPKPPEPEGEIRFWNRPRAPRYAAYLEGIYLAIASGIIFSFGSNDAWNRHMPESMRAATALPVNLLTLGGALAAACIVFVAGWLVRRKPGSRPPGRRIAPYFLLLVVVAGLAVAMLALRGAFGPPT